MDLPISPVDITLRDGYKAPKNTCVHPWKSLLFMGGVALPTEVDYPQMAYSRLASLPLTEIQPIISAWLISSSTLHREKLPSKGSSTDRIMHVDWFNYSSRTARFTSSFHLLIIYTSNFSCLKNLVPLDVTFVLQDRTGRGNKIMRRATPIYIEKLGAWRTL